MIYPKDIFLYLIGRRRDTITFNGSPAHSFSQRGEDLMVDGILKRKETGFYVDIGANHPTFLSNTKRFYNRGWSGINIEPTPELHALLQEDRPRDINLNIGVGKQSGTFNFHILSTHTNSSFSKTDALRNRIAFDDTIVKTIPIPVQTLTDVLDTYAEDKHIDFMSIDTEGTELDILKSNTWEKYSPDVLIIEIENNPETTPYLKSVGYELVYSNLCNGIYVKV